MYLCIYITKKGNKNRVKVLADSEEEALNTLQHLFDFKELVSIERMK
jgi:hypothetical protein